MMEHNSKSVELGNQVSELWTLRCRSFQTFEAFAKKKVQYINAKMYPKIVFSSPLEDRSYAKDEMDFPHIVL